jgi:hypothetical protein
VDGERDTDRLQLRVLEGFHFVEVNEARVVLEPEPCFVGSPRELGQEQKLPLDGRSADRENPRHPPLCHAGSVEFQDGGIQVRPVLAVSFAKRLRGKRPLARKAAVPRHPPAVPLRAVEAVSAVEAAPAVRPRSAARTLLERHPSDFDVRAFFPSHEEPNISQTAP